MWQYSNSLHLLSVQYVPGLSAGLSAFHTILVFSLPSFSILDHKSQMGIQCHSSYGTYSDVFLFLTLCNDDFIHRSSQTQIPSPIFLLSWWHCLYFTKTIEAIRWKQMPATKSPNLPAFVPVLLALLTCSPGWASLFSCFALSRMLLLEEVSTSPSCICNVSLYRLSSTRMQICSGNLRLNRRKQKFLWIFFSCQDPFLSSSREWSKVTVSACSWFISP